VDARSQNFISANSITDAAEDKKTWKDLLLCHVTFLAAVDHVSDTVLLVEFKLSVTTVVKLVPHCRLHHFSSSNFVTNEPKLLIIALPGGGLTAIPASLHSVAEFFKSFRDY